jgi:hypothetical protein
MRETSPGVEGSGAPVIGLAAFASVLLFALFGASTASAACPNAVFRTGPSAKLPECRAYELVTPTYTGGLEPGLEVFGRPVDSFEYQPVTASGGDVIFQLVGGALTGTPGNGFGDRYEVKRTPQGWVTEFVGTTAAQAPRVIYGGVSPDHQYYFVSAGATASALEPSGTLLAPFGGREADFLHKPNGEFELIATGSAAAGEHAEGLLITPGGSHIIFTTKEEIEPDSPPAGTAAIYDRTVGGPAKLVSVLPDGTESAPPLHYASASSDGSDVVFADRWRLETAGSESLARWYVRHDNTTTEEFARGYGVQVGRKLTCEGFASSGSLTYQWLRNGDPIGTAIAATYTVTSADEGDLLQCQVKATDSEGASIDTSIPPLIVAPYVGTNPPIGGGASIGTGGTGTGQVGKPLVCETNNWEGSPTFSYRWFRDGTEIVGASSSTYTPVSTDDEHSIQCRVEAANTDGTAVVFSNAVAIHPVPAVVTTAPKIINVTNPDSVPQAGDQLFCAHGSWTRSPTFTYRWLREGAQIATGSSYTTTGADEERSLQCLVTATTGDGATQTATEAVVVDPQPATAPPQQTFHGAIFGSPKVGESLFCGIGEWSGEPSFTYQWLRDGTEIGGATESSYTVTAGDLETVIQCGVTATNAGGSAVAVYAEASAGPQFISPKTITTKATLPAPGITYAGAFGGHVFYGDEGASIGANLESPADLFSFNIANGTTTRITDVGDARFSHISADGSHVYFVSESQIGGEGSVAKPNLYVWSRADGSTNLIATVEPLDIPHQQGLGPGQNLYGANLGTWTSVFKENYSHGLGLSNTRSTPDGSVFLFETTAQLSPYDNMEAFGNACGNSGEHIEDRCTEIYRYDADTEELTCVSCPEGASGPALGPASMMQMRRIKDLNPTAVLTEDGNTVFFESADALLPQDGNEATDIYRWKKGEGLALISTGQSSVGSALFGATPDGSDVLFFAQEKLLPQDENGGTERVYDARVDGGFPPPESTVTEPCGGDVCQGSPAATLEAPQAASSSLSGGGNLPSKGGACAKGKRKVNRGGKERCVARKHHHHHRRTSGSRRAGR